MTSQPPPSQPSSTRQQQQTTNTTTKRQQPPSSTTTNTTNNNPHHHTKQPQQQQQPGSVVTASTSATSTSPPTPSADTPNQLQQQPVTPGGGQPQATANATTPQDLTNYVATLLGQMQSRFEQMSMGILDRIDEMGKRVDDLEKSVAESIAAGPRASPPSVAAAAEAPGRIYPPSTCSAPDYGQRARAAAVSLCRVASALFPLVGRACAALARHYTNHYGALRIAAEAGSVACVNRLLRLAGRPAEIYGDGDADGEQLWDRTRRMKKEYVEVLEGLCGGGHFGLAQELVDGDWPGGYLVWPPSSCGVGGDSTTAAGVEHVGELAEHVGCSNTLNEVCRNGHWEAFRWAVKMFGIREPWQLVHPFLCAIAGGHLELAKWMAAEFDLVPKLNDYEHVFIHATACKTGRLDIVKWCFETFRARAGCNHQSFVNCIGGKSSNFVEVCQYVKERIRPTYNGSSSVFNCMRNLDVLKWAESAFSFIPTDHNLELFFFTEQGLDIAKWILERHSLALTPLMFSEACRYDNLQLIKWLFTRITLSPEHLYDSFVTAVTCNRGTVASWLSNTFRILENQPETSRSSFKGKLLLDVCHNINTDHADGLEWLLKNVPMEEADKSMVMKAAEHLVFEKGLSLAPLLLIGKLFIPEPRRSELLTPILEMCVRSYSLSLVKMVTSMRVFSKEAIARAMAGGVTSSKVVKWLITTFQLGSCAKWLITKFNITLDEVLASLPKDYDEYSSDIFLWEVLLKLFPSGLTPTLIQSKFQPLAGQSPIIVQFLARCYPHVAVREWAEQCSARVSLVPSTTVWWLNDMGFHP
ncbi:heat shock factor-binding protein 1 [Pelomyxa schiedti]|nr:heat shock factor-binding protein 1 [Pelomyxa schiedti]